VIECGLLACQASFCATFRQLHLSVENRADPRSSDVIPRPFKERLRFGAHRPGHRIGSLRTLCSRVDSSRASRRGIAASSEWCVIREGDTYFARVERSLLSNSLSACLGQPTSKGGSIGSRSVLDSTLIPVVRFRHLASVRHHGFDDNESCVNALAVGRGPAYLFAKADLGGSNDGSIQ
jgi:hypothetical protein